MKKNILAGVACATLLWSVTTGCSEETQLASGSDAGYIALALDFDPSPLTGPRGDRSRATSLEITPDDLTLTLTHASGATPPKIYTVAEFGSQQRVNTGQYTLEAAYGSADSEGWDSPWYYGSQQLTVKNESSTPVNLPVRLANAMVNVTLSKGFTDYMTDYTVTVTTASGTDYVWASDETRRLYVKPGSVMVSVAFTKPNGMQATAQVDPFTAEARHCYNINIDVEAGSAETLRLTFDDTIAEVKDVEIDITDANLPMLAAAPEILTEGFEAGSVIANVSGSAYDGLLKTTIVARGKIDTAVLNVGSSYLRSKGWPESIDLANPGAAQSLLESYGVKTLGLTGNKSVFAVVDFSGLVSRLLYVDGADNTSSFALTVTDLQGKEKTIDLFSVSVERLVLEILDGSEIISDGHATVKVRYNGTSASDIVLTAYNDRGTTDDLTVTGVKPGSLAGTYDLSVESRNITLNSNLRLYAKAGDEQSDDYVLRVPSLRLIDAETNAFAKSAYASIIFTNDEAAAGKDNVKFEVSTDNGNTYSEVASELVSATFSARSSRAGERSAVYKFSGLNPATDYLFRARLADEFSATASLTTEEAAQLPNSGMEEWYTTDVYTKTMWSFGTTGMTDIKRWHANKSENETAWATRNPMTTGQTSGVTCYYTSFSGTIPVSGTSGQAAEISTLGFGEGTTYAHTSSGKTGSPKKKISGMLFNGTYSCSGDDEAIEYGIPFNSRPVSLSFKYKFAPVSGESFKAYIVVENRNGNESVEIARGEIISGEAKNSFTDVTVPLTYTDNNLKATHIYTVFVSSTASTPTVLSVQGSKNALNGYSDSKYVGSVLTVDDIVLNY